MSDSYLQKEQPEVLQTPLPKKNYRKIVVYFSILLVVVLLLAGFYLYLSNKNKPKVVSVPRVNDSKTSNEASGDKYLPSFPEIKTTSNITEKDLPEDLKFVLVYSQNSSFKKIQYKDNTQGYIFTIEIPHITATNFHDMYTSLFFMSGGSWGVLYNVENPNPNSALEMVNEKYHVRLEWKQKDSQKDIINIETYERI